MSDTTDTPKYTVTPCHKWVVTRARDGKWVALSTGETADLLNDLERQLAEAIEARKASARESIDMVQNASKRETSAKRERDEARNQRDDARGELGEWKTLQSWGGTPEIINDFIKGQQNRIHAAQNAEEQRDRLAAAVREIRSNYGAWKVDPDCNCEDCRLLGPIDSALASLEREEEPPAEPVTPW